MLILSIATPQLMNSGGGQLLNPLEGQGHAQASLTLSELAAEMIVLDVKVRRKISARGLGRELEDVVPIARGLQAATLELLVRLQPPFGVQYHNLSGLYWAAKHVFADAELFCPARTTAQAFARAGVRNYQFQFLLASL